MKISRLGKNKSFYDFLFFFSSAFLTISFLILFITMKNDCLFLRNEIYHMEKIRTNYAHKVKILSGKVKKMDRQGYIEKIAYEKFGFHIPSPESLIVVVE